MRNFLVIKFSDDTFGGIGEIVEVYTDHITIIRPQAISF